MSNNATHTEHHPHTQSTAVYRNILIILLVLTAVTVGVSRIDFGNLNIVIALGVASFKAILVMLYFMHLKFEDKIVWMYAAIPVVLIFIMIGGIFIDNPFRGQYGPSVSSQTEHNVVEHGVVEHNATESEHH